LEVITWINLDITCVQDIICLLTFKQSGKIYYINNITNIIAGQFVNFLSLLRGNGTVTLYNKAIAFKAYVKCNKLEGLGNL